MWSELQLAKGFLEGLVFISLMFLFHWCFYFTDGVPYSDRSRISRIDWGVFSMPWSVCTLGGNKTGLPDCQHLYSVWIFQSNNEATCIMFICLWTSMTLTKHTPVDISVYPSLKINIVVKTDNQFPLWIVCYQPFHFLIYVLCVNVWWLSGWATVLNYWHAVTGICGMHLSVWNTSNRQHLFLLLHSPGLPLTGSKIKTNKQLHKAPTSVQFPLLPSITYCPGGLDSWTGQVRTICSGFVGKLWVCGYGMWSN